MAFALDPAFPPATATRPGLAGGIKPSGPPRGTGGGIINQADVDATRLSGFGLGGLALLGLGGLVVWKVFG